MKATISRIRSVPLVAIVAIALALPALALAGGGHGPGHHPRGMSGAGPGPGPDDPEMHAEMMARHLDLTDEQQAQLEELLVARRDQREATRDQMRAAREALADQIHADVFDETAVRAAAAQVAVLEADQAVARAQMFQEIKQILTPEQLERMQQMREERREFRGPDGPGARHFKRGR